MIERGAARMGAVSAISLPTLAARRLPLRCGKSWVAGSSPANVISHEFMGAPL
jgi:hypothetical protein